jgi:ketosteroid isomerase-like protein
MPDDQRKAIATAFLYAVDNGGQLDNGGTILDLFADDAQVWFPKWGLATGIEEIGYLFGDVGSTIMSIAHDCDSITWVTNGSDLIVAEGTSHGEHRDGPWQAGDPEWSAGRWCDVFEIRNGEIHRCFIYLDPDYAGRDTERYPWLAQVAAVR